MSEQITARGARNPQPSFQVWSPYLRKLLIWHGIPQNGQLKVDQKPNAMILHVPWDFFPDRGFKLQWLWNFLCHSSGNFVYSDNKLQSQRKKSLTSWHYLTKTHNRRNWPTLFFLFVNKLTSISNFIMTTDFNTVNNSNYRWDEAKL